MFSVLPSDSCLFCFLRNGSSQLSFSNCFIVIRCFAVHLLIFLLVFHSSFFVPYRLQLYGCTILYLSSPLLIIVRLFPEWKLSGHNVVGQTGLCCSPTSHLTRDYDKLYCYLLQQVSIHCLCVFEFLSLSCSGELKYWWHSRFPVYPSNTALTYSQPPLACLAHGVSCRCCASKK